MQRRLFLVLRLAALVVLGGYGWTIWHASRGAADPVWTVVQQRGRLRIGTDPGFQPFAEVHGTQWRGYDIDLATEVAHRLHLEPQFVPLGYDALYDRLAAGEVDLLAAALPLAPEQGWRARFTSAYLNAGDVLVVATTLPISNEDQLGGYTVGAALGSSGDTILQRLARADPTVRAQADFDLPHAALQALAQGRLDAVITDAVSALSLIERDPRFHIVRSLSFEPYVLATPLPAYQLQSEVNRVLDELRHEGFFERLNAKWFGASVP